MAQPSRGELDAREQGPSNRKQAEQRLLDRHPSDVGLNDHEPSLGSNGSEPHRSDRQSQGNVTIEPAAAQVAVAAGDCKSSCRPLGSEGNGRRMTTRPDSARKS